jgi:hypothetical protein
MPKIFWSSGFLSTRIIDLDSKKIMIDYRINGTILRKIIKDYGNAKLAMMNDIKLSYYADNGYLSSAINSKNGFEIFSLFFENTERFLGAFEKRFSSTCICKWNLERNGTLACFYLENGGRIEKCVYNKSHCPSPLNSKKTLYSEFKSFPLLKDESLEEKRYDKF